MIDPELAVAFAVHENPKAFALLLGSGLSRAAMIPTGWEITLDLVRKLGRLQGAPEQADWAAWRRETAGREPNYSELLDELSAGPDERRSILHRYIEPTEEDREAGRRTPTQAHRAIASLVASGYIRVIITTNFDRLLEEALREQGVQPTVLASDDAIAGAAPLIHSGCWIIKVHGDYLDTRIRNIESELAAYSSAMDRLLDRVLDDHGLIVCGWSGDWDPALRAAIERAPSRRYPLFWVSRGDPTLSASALIGARDGRIIRADSADGFFARLAERVQLQQELSRPDPRSVALVVAASKKYVAAAEHRVRLHDLISTEVARLQELLPNWQDTLRLTEQEFPGWVAKVEAALEPLVRVLAVLGRWGGEAEADITFRLIRSRLELPSASGLVSNIGLREYPAMLMAYAFGLGAMAGGRLGLVHRLFSLRVSRNGHHPGPFVKGHFLDWWDGARNAWNSLPEFAGTSVRAPLSTHLHRLFRSWAADVTLDTVELDRVFNTFETIGSLEAMLLDANAENLKLANESGDMREGIWVPLGRVLYSEDPDRFFQDWSTPEWLAELLAAGIGESDLLEPAITHLQRQVARRRLFG